MGRGVAWAIGMMCIGAVLLSPAWLAHLSSSCGDSQRGTCAALDHTGRLVGVAAGVLLAGAFVLYAFVARRLPALFEVLVYGVLALQLLWIVGFFPLYNGYQHPDRDGRGCLDECTGPFVDFWGWMSLQFVLSPFVVVAAFLAGSSVLSWMRRAGD